MGYHRRKINFSLGPGVRLDDTTLALDVELERDRRRESFRDRWGFAEHQRQQEAYAKRGTYFPARQFPTRRKPGHGSA